MRPQRLILPLIFILFNYITIKVIKCNKESGRNPKFAHNSQNEKIQKTPKEERKHPLKPSSSQKDFKDGHKLAIIVPFRDRFDELLEFVPALNEFLDEAGVNHEIIIVNQVDTYRFNRASLINAGYIYTLDHEFDYMAMHDVDLIPQTHEIKYDFPVSGPVHLASPELHPKYHYPNYVGGILMLSHQDFKKCNGMSNNFWGWGREDDELFLRMRDQGLELHRPKGVTTGYDTFKHVHDKAKRPRDYKRIGEQKKEQFKRDPVGGYHTLIHRVSRIDKLTVANAPVTVLNVELHCDKEATPWCEDK